YRVLATVPGDQDERLVAVEPGGTRPVRDFQLKMDAVAPLGGARSSREDHREVAMTQSRTVHFHHLSGKARCFIFACSKTGDSRNGLPRFALCDGGGEVIAEFPEAGKHDLSQGWLALTVDLPPGTYALEQLTTEGASPDGQGRRAQVIFAEEGWETQVLVPWGDEPNFAHASIYLRRLGSGFQSLTPDYGETEAALTGLARGQLVLPPSRWDTLAHGKVEEPMLG